MVAVDQQRLPVNRRTACADRLQRGAPVRRGHFGDGRTIGRGGAAASTDDKDHDHGPEHSQRDYHGGRRPAADGNVTRWRIFFLAVSCQVPKTIYRL